MTLFMAFFGVYTLTKLILMIYYGCGLQFSVKLSYLGCIAYVSDKNQENNGYCGRAISVIYQKMKQFNLVAFI